MTGHRMLLAEIGAPDLFIAADLQRLTRSDDTPVHQHRNTVGERDRQFELALLAMAQLGNDDVGAVSQPDPLKRRQRRLAKVSYLAGVAPEMKGVTVMRLSCQRDIVRYREVR